MFEATIVFVQDDKVNNLENMEVNLKAGGVVLVGDDTVGKVQGMRSIRLKMFNNREIIL